MADRRSMNRRPIIWATFFTALFVCPCTQGATPRGSVRDITCALTNPNVASALIENAIWITIDGGISWRQATRLPTPYPLETGEPLPDSPEEAPEDDLNTNPRVRRLTWENPDTTMDIPSADPFSDTGKPHLAVGDDGTWAASFHGRLFIGGPLVGIRRQIKLPGIRGLLIDGEGGLWITLKNTVIFLAGAADGFKGKKQYHVPGAGAPTRSTTSAGLLIPGRAGLWVVSLMGKNKATLAGPFPAPTLEAVAAAPSGDLVYAVSLGRLKKITNFLGGRTEVDDIGPTPASIDRLLIDQAGGIYLLTHRTGWFEKAGPSWHPMQVRALAIDASGRVWSGTDFGPVPPASKPEMKAVDMPRTTPLTNVLNAVITETHRWPGVPKCRKLPLNPLPEARGFFSFGRNASGHRERSLLTIGTRHETWFYMGIQLAWRFDPLTPWRCLPEQVRFLALRNRRAREVDVLWSLLQRTSMQRKAATNVLQAAYRDLDGRQLEELIRIKSGAYPNEEK